MPVSRDDELAQVMGDYRRWLYRLAYSIAGPGSNDVDDLVQEGYIAMWRALGTHDPEGGPLPPYLTQAARWGMYSAWRNRNWTGTHGRRGHVRELPADPIGDTSEDGFERLIREDQGREIIADGIALAYHHGEIARALNALAPGQREALYRRFWLDEVVNSGFWGKALPRLAEALAHLSEC